MHIVWVKCVNLCNMYFKESHWTEFGLVPSFVNNHMIVGA
mgnify:CR=1 FL=1